MRFTLLTTLISLASFFSFGQAAPCPPNLDFEDNNYNYWVFSSGSCCPILTPNAGQLIDRHQLTTGNATDPYGGFPIVSPTGGTYSLKLGNDNTGSEAEKATYVVHVPSTLTNYNLVFHYAVVFQDPGHSTVEQPRFEVRAFDSISGQPLPCAEFTFIAEAALPGFENSPNASDVKYKPWTTASVNLTGYEGQTIMVEFSTGDCSLGAHFGYGYLDLNCSLFTIQNTICSLSDPLSLTAPPGYADYLWYDENFNSLLGNGQIFNLPSINVASNFNVILIPFTGFGCRDTIFAKNMQIGVSKSVENVTICFPETYKGHSSTGTYYDTLTNAKGCDSLAILNLVVEALGCNCKFNIPNAFSPNNDNLNDFFKPTFKCGLAPLNYKLMIYNRWGQQVFITTDFNQGWNGKNDIEPYEIGTYMYHMEFVNPYSMDKIVKNGDVTLVR